MTMKRAGVVALMIVVALVAGACGDDDGGTSAGAGGVSVANAWSRNSPAVAGAAAVYLEMTNNGDVADRLVRASVPASIAGKVELHETAPAPVSPMSSTTTGGAAPMMTMKPVSSIAVPAGETVKLRPGGYHIMLMELPAQLDVGSTFDVTLTFDRAGDKTIEAEVRAS
jgi:copper(I)-binding protein